MTTEDIQRMAREAHRRLATEDYPGHTGQLDPWTMALLARFASLLRDRMIADGWRQCAQGQRTTQFCGMVEQERNRACRIVTGLCISDNNAREINEAIRTQQEPDDGNPSF